jgi:hypothetical protein
MNAKYYSNDKFKFKNIIIKYFKLQIGTLHPTLFQPYHVFTKNVSINVIGGADDHILGRISDVTKNLTI